MSKINILLTQGIHPNVGYNFMIWLVCILNEGIPSFGSLDILLPSYISIMMLQYLFATMK